MALKFEHILPGEGVRAGEVEAYAFIDYCAKFALENAVMCIPRLWQLADNRFGTLACEWAGNTDNSNAPTSGRRSNGSNGFDQNIHGPVSWANDG